MDRIFIEKNKSNSLVIGIGLHIGCSSIKSLIHVEKISPNN